jgi:protease I
MQKKLSGLKAAILVANGFNELEMTVFQRAMMEMGAFPRIISVESGLANGWQGSAWGHYYAVDCQLSDALAADYDILLIPGGMRSLDKLKLTGHTKRFIGGFLAAYKPVMLMNDAPVLLAQTGQIKDMMVTVPESNKAVIEQAQAYVELVSPCMSGNVMSALIDKDNAAEIVETFVNFVVSNRQELETEQQVAA